MGRGKVVGTAVRRGEGTGGVGRSAAVLALGMVAALWGCSADSGGGGQESSSNDAARDVPLDLGPNDVDRPPDAGDGASPTWSGAVAAVLGARCVSCHSPGEAAPFSFQTYAETAPRAQAIADAVSTGRMPPWPADPGCRHYADERVLTEGELATLTAWAESGALAGDATVVATPPDTGAALPAPDVVTRAVEAYAPDPARPDDYRCFELDAAFPTETYITAVNVRPDVRPIVHHVLIYVVAPARQGDLAAMDAADEGPGYTCYGGTGLGTAGPLGAWVPGYQPFQLPAGTAQVIPAGSKLVMQIHYNTQSAAPAADRTAVELWTTPTVPEQILRTRPLANLGLSIPAGEAHVVQTKEIRVNGARDWNIVASGAHMHMLGTRIRVDAIDAATGAEACLIDIPRWDFNWQMSYRLRPDETLTVHPGDTLRLTCEYDNSAAHQPVFDGVQLTPRDVAWGEGTTDEMCLDFISVVEPYVADAGVCPDYEACRGGCAEPDGFACLLECAQQDQACATCLLQGVSGPGGCARTQCTPSIAAAATCLRGCAMEAVTSGASLTACLESTCPDEYAALRTCMDAALSAGACDGDLATCDVAR